MQNYSVSILIPCFNEEGNIAECIHRTPTIGTSTEIIVINDGSSDATESVVKSVAKEDPRVQLISYSANKGKACALQEGVLHAVGEIVIILDADMTVEPELMSSFYNAFMQEQCDMVIGTRFKQLISSRAMSIIKQWSNRISSVLFSLILKQSISDTLCGTKIMWKKDAQRIDFQNCRWGDFEILRYAARNKLKIRELPIHYRERTAGESAMRLYPDGLMLYKRGIEIFFEVLWYDFVAILRK